MGRSNHVATLGLGLVVSLGFVTSCSGKDPYSPGTKLGTFHVTAKLTQTTCGPTPNPWEFDVKLNHDGSTLYWIQGDAPIQGIVDAAAKTQLKSETTHDVRAADIRTKTAACTIARSDVLDVALAAADAAPTADPAAMATFAGGLAYTFAPTAGSECFDQLTSAGGGFEALPCEVHYEIAGVLKTPPPSRPSP